MEANQIVDKIENAEFTKDELVFIVEVCAIAICLQNHKD